LKQTFNGYSIPIHFMIHLEEGDSSKCFFVPTSEHCSRGRVRALSTNVNVRALGVEADIVLEPKR